MTMNHPSIWKGTAPESDFPVLREELTADVVIVGGGITGLMTAQQLGDAGKQVVVLESGTVGSGTTGYSTGNLYAVLSDYLYTVGEKWDEATLKAVAQARNKGLDLIEDTIAKHGIECDFARQPLHLFAIDRQHVSQVEKEHQAAITAGLPAVLSDTLNTPFHVNKALTIAHQAQFHPLQFTIGLAKAIASDRCRIFEGSKALLFDDRRGAVETEHGRVNAEHIVLATHTPKGINMLHTELGPYREYGVAAQINEPFPEGIFWGIGSARRSIRSYRHHDQHFLLVVGEDHKVGQQEDTQIFYETLENYLHANFGTAPIAYRWSAQHYHAADGIPYIGRSIGADNVYVATGFGKDGLVYGATSARVIGDAILGRDNPWRELFDPRRFNPSKSAKDFLSENLNVAGYFLKDYLAQPGGHAFADIAPGEGKLVKVDGERVAAYRDPTGELFLLSPVCTHMKCIVHWNRAEKSWDCPCHGTRFRVDGEVIEGPAIAPLQRKLVPPGQ